MKIFVQISTTATKVVEVHPDAPYNTLWNELNIPLGKFIYRGKTYGPGSFETFAEIGMKNGDRIFFNLNKLGGGEPLLKDTLKAYYPEHICPYGCGRMIPDGYKGCTELLQERPNYFN